LMLRAEVRVMRPVIAFCFLTRFCRERLLGRNLITLFPTVNNLSQFFFATRASRVRRDSPRQLAHDARRMRPGSRMRTGKCENAGEKAAFPDWSRARMHARASHPTRPASRAGAHRQARRAALATTRAASPLRVAQARLRKTARTFFAQTDDPRTRKRKKTRGVGRGFRSRTPARDKDVSGLRLPAVRRSRPAPAVR
jgi:hypothetical protein